ncbi:hypothetical protein NKG05_05710 [Oerskovia sp. M15]
MSTASLAFSGAGPITPRRANASCRQPPSSSTRAPTRSGASCARAAPGSSAS